MSTPLDALAYWSWRRLDPSTKGYRISAKPLRYSEVGDVLLDEPHQS